MIIVINKFVRTYLLAIVTLVSMTSLITAGLMLSLKEAFNPEKHVCLLACPEGFTDCKHETYGYSSNGCIDWRDRTYCEKNPYDVEKCICEERNGSDKIRFINRGSSSVTYDLNDNQTMKKCIANGKYEDDYVLCETAPPNNMRVVLKKFHGSQKYAVDEKYEVIKAECLKVREKSECEKGNEMFIIENGRCYDKCSNYLVGTVCEADICREKTISDLSCEELKEEYACTSLFPSPTCLMNVSKRILLFEFIERCGGKR